VPYLRRGAHVGGRELGEGGEGQEGREGVVSVEELDSHAGPAGGRRRQDAPEEVLRLDAPAPAAGPAEAPLPAERIRALRRELARRPKTAAVVLGAFALGALLGGAGVHEWRDARAAAARQDTVALELADPQTLVRLRRGVGGGAPALSVRLRNRGPVPVQVESVGAASDDVRVRDVSPATFELPAGSSQRLTMTVDVDCARVAATPVPGLRVTAVPPSGQRHFDVVETAADPGRGWLQVVRAACGRSAEEALTAAYDGPADPAGADAFAARLRISAAPDAVGPAQVTSLQMFLDEGPTTLRGGLPVSVTPGDTVVLVAGIPLPGCDRLDSLSIADGIDLQYALRDGAGDIRVRTGSFATLGSRFQRDLLRATDARCP
jgi:hypothetical protein